MSLSRRLGAGFCSLVLTAACGGDAGGPASDDAGGEGGSAGDGGGTGGSGQSQGGSAQGGGPDVPIQAEDGAAYIEQVASLFCGGLADCCADAGFAFSEQTCLAFLSGSANLDGLTYDRAAGEACLAELQSLLGNCGGEGASLVCPGVFLGSTELGEPCDQDAECVPSDLGDVSCEFVGSSFDERMCVVNIRAGEGDPCVDTCFEASGNWYCLPKGPGPDSETPERGQCYLNDGLHCDTSTLECVPTLDRGEDCTFSEDCGAFAVCDGTCEAGLAEGTECVDFGECQEGLICSFEEQVCRPGEAENLEEACTSLGGQ